MKILQINANYGFGSTGLIVKDIGDIARENGFETFFAYQKKNQEIKNGFVVGNALDWKIHAIMCRVFGAQGYYSIFPTLKLIRKIKRLKPDVIHLHNLHSNYVNINILLKYIAKNDIATVITMHDCWYFTGKCFHYVDCKCDRFMQFCGNCPKKNADPQSYIFDRSSYCLNNKKKRLISIPRLTVVGCSDWICSEAKKGFLSECNIERIYNGVDVSIFKPTTSSIREDNNVNNNFLVMGMANKWLLKENIDMLSSVACMPNTRLMIVGCTNEQKEKIKSINSNIIAIGFITDRVELAKYYSAADVFVNLTHADTLPTVNMESICCGTPVITYDSCGSPELVDSNTGIVVEENDEAGILSAISEIRDKNFSKCSQYGINRFDKNICYKRYLEIYRYLLTLKVEK